MRLVPDTPGQIERNELAFVSRPQTVAVAFGKNSQDLWIGVSRNLLIAS
jgi:hypothetical protein